MKAFFKIIIILTFTSYVNGQIPKWTDFKLYPGQSYDAGNSITVDKNNNYYLTLSFGNPMDINNDPVSAICNFILPEPNTFDNGALLRYDSAKNLNLKIEIKNGTLGELVVDSVGNICVSGMLQYGASADGFLNKYTPTGNIIWSKLVQSFHGGGNDMNFLTSLDLYKDGTMVICGFCYGEDAYILDQHISGPISFVTKLTSNGDVLWTKNFGSDLGTGAKKVKFDKNGNILVGGDVKNTITNHSDAFITKLNSIDGSIVWDKHFELNSPNGYYSPITNAISACDNFYTFGGNFGAQVKIGDTILTSAGGYDIFLLQTDTAGNVIWVNKAGSPGRDKIFQLLTNENRVTFITGSFSDGFQVDGNSYSSKGNTDIFISAIDSLGKSLWVLTGGSTIPGHTDDLFFDENGASIAIDSKKQIHIVGTTIGSGNFGGLKYYASEDTRLNAFWLTVGSNDSVMTTTYSCNGSSINTTLPIIINVNPNPFFKGLTISNSGNYFLDYELFLYNSVGQKISSKYFPNSIIVQVDDWMNLIKGIYFLKINAGTLSRTVKLIKQ